MKNNDERIIKLKEGIDKKRLELSKVKKFEPVTTCMLNHKGKVLNLHVLKLDDLMKLLVQLNLIRMSVEDLGLKDYKISHILVEDWITDIKGKIATLNVKEEELKLREMECKLDKLLSEEKKTELELDEIEEMLK